MAEVGEERAAGLSDSRSAASAGMVAPVFFVTVFTVEGWLRPGYDQASMFVSELSIGPRGWVQVANFVITGVLLLYFTRGVAIHLNWNKTARVGITLLRIIGWSLVLSGLFVTDPSALFNQVSVHGLLHGLFGVLVFSLAPVSCFVYSACFRPDPVWRPLAPVTLSAGIIIAVGIVFLKVSQFPQSELYSLKGLIQRLLLLVFMAWIYVFARRMFTLSVSHHSFRR